MGGRKALAGAVSSPALGQHTARRVVEPFCGGLAVTMGLLPKRALLNDINPHVINFYRWLKRGLTTSLVMKNEERLYYQHRDRFNELLREGEGDSAEAAALFYYLNRTGYNGLCRFNRKAASTFPSAAIPESRTRVTSPPIGNCLRTGTSSNRFRSHPLKPDDLVYADPPYDVEFRQYSKDGFSWEDQVRAAQWLARHPGPVGAFESGDRTDHQALRALGIHTEISPSAAHD